MSLAPEWRIGDLSLTEYPYSIRFGSDHGSPENVVEVLQSLLQDGDIELSSRSGNRTLSLPVLLEGADLAAVADAEAALVAECDQDQNELYCDPGDGFGAPFVFTVFRGQLTFTRDDAAETAGLRSYTLTFRALPFPRSDAEVTAEALAASGTTTTVINDGSTTTNWTSTSGTVTSASGKVKTTAPGTLSGYHDLTYTAAVSMAGFPYMYVDWTADSTIPASFKAYADGVALTRIALVPLPAAGWYRHYFECPDTSVAAFKFEAYIGVLVTSLTTPVFQVDQVVKTDVAPSLGSTRQLLRTVGVAGAVRTQARLAVEHATSALGDVMVYTFPDDGRGYVPALRNYLTTHSPTTDASMVSGGLYTLSAIANYDIPQATLPPGIYQVIARMRKTGGTASQTIRATASALVNSAVLEQTADIQVALTTYTMTSTWTNYLVGTFQLPTVDVDSPTASALTRLTITDTDLTDDIDVDDVWAFNLTTGNLTMVKCGTAAPSAGGSSNRLFLLPPTVDSRRPRVLVGYAEDGSDAHYPVTNATHELTSWMDHEFVPPSMSVFTVCSNALDASATLSHFPRWHSHAAA